MLQDFQQSTRTKYDCSLKDFNNMVRMNVFKQFHKTAFGLLSESMRYNQERFDSGKA